jgi:hypothetical protein
MDKQITPPGEVMRVKYGHMRLATNTRENLFFEWMQFALCTHKPDAVVYEDIKRSPGAAQAHSFGGYRAIMNLVCQRAQIETVGVGVGEWKKHLCGKGYGNCKKPKKSDTFEYQPIVALRERGYHVTDDNEADAIGILLYALECGVVEKVQ